jgi:hypothetical protein
MISWRKSTKCADGSGACVEAGPFDDDSGRVAVRHSVDPHGPVVTFSQQEWIAFVAGVRAGEFDFHAA